MDLFDQVIEYTFNWDGSVKDIITKKYERTSYGFTPEELGIDQPGINKIFFDECGGKGDPLHYQQVSWGTAHAHGCRLDPLYHSICVMKNHLRNSDGTLSNIFWHEYGHVIAKDPVLLTHTEIAGTQVHSFTVGSIEYSDKDEKPYLGYAGESPWQDVAHGKEWEEAMRSLGKGHLISRFCSPPY